MITDLALPKPRAPANLSAALRRLLPGEEVRQVQTKHSDGAGAQQFAAGGSFASVTAMSGNDEHDDPPLGSVVVQKRFAVDQRPQQILRARRARPPPDCRYFSPDSSSAGVGGRLSDARYNSSTSSRSRRPLSTALAMRPLRVRHRVRDGPAVDQVQRLRQAEVRCGARTRRPTRARAGRTDRGSRPCRCADRRPARRVGLRRRFGKYRPDAGGQRDRVHQLFRAQAARHGVREVVAVGRRSTRWWRCSPDRCANWRWCASGGADRIRDPRSPWSARRAAPDCWADSTRGCHRRDR